VDGVSSSDALDKEVWRRLRAIVAVGNQGDADALSGLWQTLEREVPDDQRGLAGVYVWYLVQQVNGGKLVVSASAAVSVLLDDPNSQFAIIRPPLARWSARNAGRLRELGPMAPPRSAP
jgi:hypothetical protein